MNSYEEEIKKIKDRLLQIEEEFKKYGADKIKLKNEYDELLKKLNYLEMAAIKDVLIKEYYDSKQAMDEAAKKLEEAGIILEQEEKLKAKSVNKSSSNTAVVMLVGVAAIVYGLTRK